MTETTTSAIIRPLPEQRHDNPDPEMKGWLLKWTNYLKGYQKRWFVLSKGVLSYYRNQTEMTHTCRGTISLHGALIHTVDSCTFVVSNGGTQTFHIKTTNEVERQSWVTSLELAKVKAIRAMESEEDEASENLYVVPSEEVITVVRELNDRLESLRTCYDLITKHGLALQGALTDLKSTNVALSDEETLVSRIKIVNERATLFRITSKAMINACTDYIRSAELQGYKWSKALQHERDNRQRLEDVVEQLAKQHTQLEQAAHLVQRSGLQAVMRSRDNSPVRNNSSAIAQKSTGIVVGAATAAAAAAAAASSSLSDDEPEFFDAEDGRMCFSTEHNYRHLVPMMPTVRSKTNSSSTSSFSSDVEDAIGMAAPTTTTSIKTKKAIGGGANIASFENNSATIATAATTTTSNLTNTTTNSNRTVSKGGDASAVSSNNHAFNHDTMMMNAAASNNLSNTEMPYGSTFQENNPVHNDDSQQGGDGGEQPDPTDSGDRGREQQQQQPGDDDGNGGNSPPPPSPPPPPPPPNHNKPGNQQTNGGKRVRRTRVPNKPNYPLNLWSIMKNCIGKELSKIPMPVNFNEPLSMLQRLTEDYEYAHILDQAAKIQDECEQLAYLAAFTVSAYATTASRTGKPFNPLLGETYECDRTEDLGWRCIAEQVSHHPPMAAIHCEGRDWVCWQEFTMTSKFRGKYLQIIPLGNAFAVFTGSDRKYTWRKVTTTVNNIIVGKLWVDQHGDMEIKGLNKAEGFKCILKYIPYSYFSRDVQRKVKGYVMNREGDVKWLIEGTWDNKIEIARVLSLSPGSTRENPEYVTEPFQLVWERVKPADDSEKYYNFTLLAAQLNEMEEGVAPTDSRLRPDQRLMEEGRWNESNQQKVRLEEKQRSKRKLRDSEAEKAASAGEPFPPYEPVWFTQQHDGDSIVHVHTGNYWEHKARQDWSKCPNIF